MLRTSTDFAYYYLNQTLVDPDLAKKKIEILKENTVNVGGSNYCTLSYIQVLQSFNCKNWNGREYSPDITLNSINNDPLIQWDIKHGVWNCEYGHPAIGTGENALKRQLTIDPKTACNTINKYWLDGNLLMGECTTLYGSWGEVLMGRLITGQPAMASSRAIGGVDSRGRVLPGYKVVTFDTVMRASHKEAFSVKGSEKYMQFTPPNGNTFNESVTMIRDITKDESFVDFVLTESADKVHRVLDTFNLDYSSITFDKNTLKINKINESSVDTIFIPIKKLISAEYHNLLL